MLNLQLDKILKSYLYNSYKNRIKLVLLAQAATKINKNYYIQIKITISIVKKLQFINIIDKNSLLDHSNTLYILAGIEVI